jgi:membrane-associated protease RseP (regulator of RpoE activity)
MGSPAKNRNSLLELGLAGPLAGFLLSVPAALIGLKYSSIAPLSVGLEDEIIFPMPLILMLISEYTMGGPFDPETVIQPHPIAMAAWIGFFVTALNLLPVGQLDGGHVIRALLPIHYRKIFLTTLFIFPPVLVFFFSPLWLFYWPIWVLLVILMWMFTRIDHPGPLNDVSEMDRKRKIYGAAILLLLLILCFPPAPPIPTEILSNI